jgi:hypothetical protein
MELHVCHALLVHTVVLILYARHALLVRSVLMVLQFVQHALLVRSVLWVPPLVWTLVQQVRRTVVLILYA